MRHSPSIEPSTHIPLPALHPKLQRALGCLDTRLDEELTRYRRQKAGHSVPPVNGLKRKQAPNLDLMAIASTASAADRANLTSVPPALSAESIPLRGEVPVIEPDLSSDLAVIPPHTDLETDGSLIYSSPAMDGDRGLADSSTPPDDYLESSEELLRSLAREEAHIQVERGFLESLLTPLGVGSMLMLLLSSAMFGYVIMNPSSLSGLGQIFARREATPSPVPTSALGAQGNISNSPPLDAQEFVDLGLGNLTTLKTRPTSGLPQNGKPSPKASASPSPSPSAPPKASQPSLVAPSSPVDPSSGSAPVQSAPIARPNPAPVAPSYSRSNNLPAPTIRRAPAPLSLPTVPIARPQPPIERAPAPTVAPQPRAWHVDTPYDSDRTYDKIQQSNPGAEFVNTPEGGFVRSGSYRSEAEAKAKVQELQNQGIPAEVSK
jgi:hypothetical protein